MEALITLFDRLTSNLEQLSALAREKTNAVRRDDLLGLDEVLKKEQALALAVRGLEQKQTTLLRQYNLDEVPLSELPRRFPKELQLQAKNSVERLRNQFQIYQAAAHVARDTLECNLHEIEKYLAANGAGSALGAGYAATADLEPPAPMKTDFRA